MVVKLATGDFHSTNVIKQGGIGAVTGGLASRVTVGLKPTNLPENTWPQSMNGMTPSTTQRSLVGSLNLRSTSAVKSPALETAYDGVYTTAYTGTRIYF
jgi:hypothetical protein